MDAQASTRNLDLKLMAKPSVPVLSAAFLVAAIWLYYMTYSSSRGLTSQPITVTTDSSSQEPDDDVDNRLPSLRKNKPPNLKFNPTTTVQLARKYNHFDEPGFELRVVTCKYMAIFDNIAEGRNMILDNLRLVNNAFPFPVKAFIPRDVNWSTQNLCLLTQQLHSFWKVLGDGQRCTKLTIQLPFDPLDEVTDGAGILAVTTDVLLPLGLRTLEWMGNREQLPMFFQSQPGFSTLTNLTIRSDLSMDDCKTLLYWGRQTLRSVAFWTIRDVDPGDVRVSLPPVPSSVQLIEMAALRSLTIASTVDIRPLYSLHPLIRFPVLREVTLSISDPAFNIWKCRGWLTIGGLNLVERWKVHCPMRPEEEARMKANYPLARIMAGIPNL